MESVDYATAGLASGLIGFGIVLFLVITLLVLAIVILEIAGEWKIFKKAGKNGWEAIVPIYNCWILVEIAGLNWWWFLLILLGSVVPTIGPLVSLFALFVCNYNIAKKFHKEVGTAILMTLFPYIMYPIMGFGKDYNFDNSVEVSKNGVF